jgi:hypothetical protein
MKRPLMFLVILGTVGALLGSHAKASPILTSATEAPRVMRIEGATKPVFINPPIPTDLPIDTLKNDDGRIFYYVNPPTFIFASRMTDGAGCSLQYLQFAKYRKARDSARAVVTGCSLFVWQDTVVSGQHGPGVRLVSGYARDSFPRSPSTTAWFTYDLRALNLALNQNFWCGFRGAILSTADSLWGLGDSTAEVADRNAIASGSGGPFTLWATCDFLNRAIVSRVAAAIHDVGVEQIIMPDTVRACSTYTIQARIKNYGAYTENFPASLDIIFQGTSQYHEIMMITALAPGATVIVTFPPFHFTEPCYHVVKCSTQLATDQNHVNDVLTKTVVAKSKDVEIDTLWIEPGPPYKVCHWFRVKAGVHNKSQHLLPDDILYDVPVIITVKDPAGGQVLQNTIVVPRLVYCSTYFVTSDSFHLDTAGTWTIRAEAILAGDNFPLNNVAGLSIVAVTGGTPGWSRKADVPTGSGTKKVKDGGCLAYNQEPPDSIHYMYAFKGNNTLEFYKYNTVPNVWTTPLAIPLLDKLNQKKKVKKGAVLVGDISEDSIWCVLYGAKGNNTLQWWQYNPMSNAWVEKASVPGGTKLKGGSSACVMDRDIPGVNEPDSVWVYLLKGSGTNEFYRYNPVGDFWQAMAPAPLGASGKGFKYGSSICYNDVEGDSARDLIYALKGSYNEFYAYDVVLNTWSTLKTLPILNRDNKKKKVKDGGSIACNMSDSNPTRRVYALKGGNTLEFWKYFPENDDWQQWDDVPLGAGKKVKGGGALMYAEFSVDPYYALKGNNTLEFYEYIPNPPPLASAGPNALSQRAASPPVLALRAAPSLFRGRTVIDYSLPRAGNISLRLYDVTGALVTTLAHGYTDAGAYTTSLDASKLVKGIYILKYETESYSATEKLIVE